MRASRPSRMFHRAVAAVVVMAAVPAACSGDDDDDVFTSSTQPPSSTEQAPEPTDAVSSTEPSATDTTPPAVPGLVLGYLRLVPGLLLDLSGAQQAAPPNWRPTTSPRPVGRSKS